MAWPGWRRRGWPRARGTGAHRRAPRPLGGVAAVAGPGAPLVEWLVRECATCRTELGPTDGRCGTDEVVVQCTGGRTGLREYEIDDGAVVLDIADVRAGTAPVPTDGTIALFDPIGGPIAVALAEELGERAVLITQDQIAGNELSRTGDLAPANVRLAQRGVRIERRSLLRAVRAGEVELEDRFTGARRTMTCSALVDCGFRLPTDPLAEADLQAGDCVAPRTIHEAMLEGRRAALAVDHVARRAHDVEPR